MASTLTPPPQEAFDGWQPDEDQSNSTGLSGVTLFGIIMGVLLLVVIFLGYLCFVSRRGRKSTRTERRNHRVPVPPAPNHRVPVPPAPNQNVVARPIGIIVSPRLPKIFTYKELEEATHNFAESNFLGEGGFGHVHRGCLAADGKAVAIKKLKPGSQQGEDEFVAEIKSISGIHHRNLVHLVGYCFSGPQRLLVYEFIPKKSLESHLHGADKSALNWVTRFNIALGTANGLAYLHESCNPKIIHRDIKSANILLDDNFEAKVADFGLAKLFPDDQTHVSTLVKGTYGYLDPEYFVSGKLTEKSDVYSFGILLLELITGIPPKGDLALEAKALLTKAVKEGNFSFVDRDLQDYDKNQMSRVVGCAAACVCYSTTERPKMSQIYDVLKGSMDVEVLTVKGKSDTEFYSNEESGTSGSSNYVDCRQSLSS